MEQKKAQYEYSAEKNQQLIKERGISFEDIVTALDSGGLRDTVVHPNRKKYPHQKMYVIEINDYMYLVPFIRKDDQTVFLKTVFPSRKAKKQYAKVEVSNED